MLTRHPTHMQTMDFALGHRLSFLQSILSVALPGHLCQASSAVCARLFPLMQPATRPVPVLPQLSTMAACVREPGHHRCPPRMLEKVIKIIFAPQLETMGLGRSFQRKFLDDMAAIETTQVISGWDCP